MIEYLVNPLFLFLTVWGTAIALYLAGVYGRTFAAPAPLTLGTLALNVGTFSLGYLTWTVFRRSGPPAPAAPLRIGRDDRSRVQPLTPQRLARLLQFTALMGLLALALVLYRVGVIASASNTTFAELLTRPDLLRQRLVTFIDRNVYQTSRMVMLIAVTSSLFSLGFALLGVFLYVSKTAAKYAYLCVFLLLGLAIGLLNLSRYEVTVNILYLVFAYCLARSAGRDQAGDREATSPRARVLPWRTFPALLLPLATVAVLFIAVDLLLRKGLAYGLTGRLEGFLYSLYWYAASPLAAFNDWLTSFPGGYDLGENTFFPLYKWLYRLHLVAEPQVSIYGEIIFVPYVANVYTYLRSFYEDFGLFGVALAPYLLGWATAALQTRARRYFPYLNLYAILLVFLLFSFYNYFLFSNQIYLQILFGFLFFRYRLADPQEFTPCPGSADTRTGGQK